MWINLYSHFMCLTSNVKGTFKRNGDKSTLWLCGVKLKFEVIKTDLFCG